MESLRGNTVVLVIILLLSFSNLTSTNSSMIPPNPTPVTSHWPESCENVRCDTDHPVCLRVFGGGGVAVAGGWNQSQHLRLSQVCGSLNQTMMRLWCDEPRTCLRLPHSRLAINQSVFVAFFFWTGQGVIEMLCLFCVFCATTWVICSERKRIAKKKDRLCDMNVPLCKAASK